MNEAKVVPNREISMYYTAGVNLIREQRDEARAIARKLYAENKRLKAYIEFDRQQRLIDGRSR